MPKSSKVPHIPFGTPTIKDVQFIEGVRTEVIAHIQKGNASLTRYLLHQALRALMRVFGLKLVGKGNH